MLVGTGTATFIAAGVKKVVVKLTSKGKALLKHAKSIKLTATGSFTATGKVSVTSLKAFTLKR